ncbi:MAG TPA: hydroxymethylbilane synthase [Myxococcales bacterium]|nr:hydroxymethylbilane synthase [Myxococcales bacterium]
MTPPLRIGTRRSALALWQANHVAGLLRAGHPGLEVTLVEITTQGDRFLQAPLAEVGGKGLFVQEIEQALLRGEVDLAVHSLKDLPAEMPAGLVLAAPPPREDPRDALVSRHGAGLAALPEGARVGTSSLRRAVQLRARRRDLRIVSIRGNVQTRLERAVGAGKDPLDAVVLAQAGLTRLGLHGQVSESLDPDAFVPAVGQGILGLQRRVDDRRVAALVGPLGDRDAEVAARAERALLARLGAGCHVPLGGYARQGDRVKLVAMLGDPETLQLHRVEREGPAGEAERVGREAADALLAGDGGRLLASFRPAPPPES